MGQEQRSTFLEARDKLKYAERHLRKLLERARGAVRELERLVSYPQQREPFNVSVWPEGAEIRDAVDLCLQGQRELDQAYYDLTDQDRRLIEL